MTPVALQVTQPRLRLSAASAVAGGLLGLMVNLAHGDLPADPEAALTRVAATATWGLLHLGIMATVVFLLVGLFGMIEIAQGPTARALARMSLVVAVPGAALMLAGTAIDGFATKSLADLWASAPVADKAAAFRVAVAVEEVQNALFHAWAALFIGLPFILLGLSELLDGGGFPRWLATIGLTGGTGAFCMGVAGFLHVPVPGPLFNISALLVTLWVLGAGVVLWRTSVRAGAS